MSANQGGTKEKGWSATTLKDNELAMYVTNLLDGVWRSNIGAQFCATNDRVGKDD